MDLQRGRRREWEEMEVEGCDVFTFRDELIALKNTYMKQRKDMTVDDHNGTLGIVIEHNVETIVRDGTTLRSNVYRPDDDARYPGLLTRTPYCKDQEGLGLARYAPYVRAGYAVVVQDSRGRYQSDGDFIPQYIADTAMPKTAIDTVEWLATQDYCNGKVGAVGHSYNAWMDWMLAKLQPPHLQAMANTACPFEWNLIDFPGGFRPGRRLHWLMCHMAPDMRRRQGLPSPHTYREADRLWQELEHGRLLGLLPYGRLPEVLPPGLREYVAQWLENPTVRPWRFDLSHSQVTVPNIDFTGWFDHCVSTIRTPDHGTAHRRHRHGHGMTPRSSSDPGTTAALARESWAESTRVGASLNHHHGDHPLVRLLAQRPRQRPSTP